MKKAYFIFPILTLLIMWFLLSFFKIINPLFLPRPDFVFIEILKLILSGSIFFDLFHTLYRLFLSFILSVLIGVPLGLLIGYYKKLYSAFSFLIDFFRSIPPMALFPLFLLFFGIGDLTKIAIVVFSCSLIIIVNTAYGVRIVPKSQIILAKTFKANKFQIFSKIILPSSLINLFSSFRIIFSLCLMMIIVLEMFVGTRIGLGYRIINAQWLYKTIELYSFIILTGLIGYIFNKIFILIERRITPP